MSSEIIRVDGSFGEGGGQILRSSVALSLLTGKPVEVFNIRAKRPNPGLRPQHKSAIEALARMSNSKVEGCFVGSRMIRFFPGEIIEGKYKFDIGTAGSVTLFLQALLPALIFSGQRFEIQVRGGTHVSFSPTWDYYTHVFFEFLRRCGHSIEGEILRYGFYPKGGGCVRVFVKGGEQKGIDWREKGELIELSGISISCSLPEHIAKRQAMSAMKVLWEYEPKIEKICCESLSPGTAITLWATFENGLFGATSLGKKGKRAEDVGKEAGERLKEYIKAECTVDLRLEDQILVYLALASESSKFKILRPTGHFETNMWVIKKFLPVEFKVKGNQIEVFP